MNTPVETFFQADWNEYARCYDALMYLTPYKKTVSKVATSVITIEGGRILDASCGTGNFEEIFSSLEGSEKFHITGIDTSAEMLTQAKQKCGKLSNTTFLEADLNKKIPFHGETFSQIVSINTLYAVKDPETTLHEFHRLLVPLGRLLLVTPKHGYENGEMLREHANSQKPAEYWKEVHQNAEREELLIREAVKDPVVVDDMLTVARHNRAIASNGIFHFFESENLVTLLTKVGFDIESQSFVSSDQDIFIIAKKGA